jgi:hypothetical protein
MLPRDVARQSISRATLIVVAAGLVAASAGLARSEKAGCPLLTRAEARAALGDVGSMSHRMIWAVDAIYPDEPGEKMRFNKKRVVEYCFVKLGAKYRGAPNCPACGPDDWGQVDIRFRGIGFDGHSLYDFKKQKAVHKKIGTVRDVRGLGALAYRFVENPSDGCWRGLWVLADVRNGEGREIGIQMEQCDPAPPFGSFIAVARAILKRV